LKNKES
jgi:chromosome segregation ATPase